MYWRHKFHNNRLKILFIFILKVMSVYGQIALDLDTTCFGCLDFIFITRYYYISQIVF